MANMTSMVAYVRPGVKAKACFELFRYLPTHSPLVDDLEISRDLTEDFVQAAEWHASLASVLPLRANVSSPLALRFLELSDLRLGESSCALLHEIDMSKLKGLYIYDCIGKWGELRFSLIMASTRVQQPPEVTTLPLETIKSLGPKTSCPDWHVRYWHILCVVDPTSRCLIWDLIGTQLNGQGQTITCTYGRTIRT